MPDDAPVTSTFLPVEVIRHLTLPPTEQCGRRRHVERRVAIEEAERDELEARVLDGHHRPVLGTRDVRDAERVPEHDVGADERPVGRCPPRQSVFTGRLVRMRSGRPPLARLVRRDPQVAGGERGAAADRRGRDRRAASASIRARACTRPAGRARCGRSGSRSSTCGCASGRRSASRRARCSRRVARGRNALPIGLSSPAGSATTSTSYTSLAGPSTSMSSRTQNRC